MVLPSSVRTRRLSPVRERSITEESMVNCFEMLDSAYSGVIDGFQISYLKFMIYLDLVAWNLRFSSNGGLK